MNTIYKILAVIGIIVACFLWFTRPEKVDLKEYIKIDGKEYELLKRHRDTVYLDSIVEVPTYVPSPPKIIKEIITLPADIDSLEVIQKYYSRYVQNDTIDINDLGKAFITDIITQNKIESRTATFDIKIPEITETIYVKEKPKTKVFVGMGGNLNINTFTPQAGYGSIMMTNKKDRAYSIDIGISNTSLDLPEWNPYVGGTIYWKLNFGKN